MKATVPNIKKWIKAALDMGLPVSGFEVLADGSFRLLTTPPQQDQADAELDRFLRSQNG